MTFILRCVLIIMIFAFIVYVMKAIARLSHRLRLTMKDLKDVRDDMGGRKAANAEMVRCATCGAFVSSRDAVTMSSRKSSMIFCSGECARSYIAK